MSSVSFINQMLILICVFDYKQNIFSSSVTIAWEELSVKSEITFAMKEKLFSIYLKMCDTKITHYDQNNLIFIDTVFLLLPKLFFKQ